MITKYKNKSLTLLDVLNPSKDEIVQLMEEYGLKPLVADELLVPTLRDKVDLYKNFIYLVFHFPKSRAIAHESREHEVDFILGKRFMIVVHYGPINPLYDFFKAFEANTLLKEKWESNHSGFLFFYLIRVFYKHSIDKIIDIGANLKEIEKNIFDGKEGEMVEALSRANRKLIEFKQSTHLHRDVLLSFEKAAEKFYGVDFSHYLKTIIGEYNRVQSIFENQKSILNDLRETNDSLLADKTGHTMKKLTTLNFIMLPLTVIVNLFVITKDSYFVENIKHMYFLVFGLFILGMVLYFYFKKRRWI